VSAPDFGLFNRVGLGTDTSVVDDLKVTRWARYGQERLYVNTADGQRVGWLDVKTGKSTFDIPDLAAAFLAALDGFHSGSRGQLAPTSAEAPPPLSIVPVAPATEPDLKPPPTTSGGDSGASRLPDWVDLAANRPGQTARTQAEAELAAMRERTKVRTYLARLIDAKTDERAWRVGAGGEETVGARLEKLTSRGWYVLHAVPVGTEGSDIDHILIGPGGVYTINTKTHPGGKVWVGRYAIKVNGQSVPYLRNSRFEAERASNLLSDAIGWAVPVRPVLVFLTGTLIPNVTIKQQPEDVLVLDRMDIPGAFKRSPFRITPEQIGIVHEIARRSSTWQGTPK
jgi:hypothetical protein